MFTLHTVPMPSWKVSKPERLDAFLAREGQAFSRGLAQKAIEEGQVSVNGEKITKSSARLKEGDKVALKGDMEREESGDLKPADLKLEILYEDDECFVINKPVGISVHPGAGMEPEEKTLLHGIMHLFKKKSLPFSEDSVLVHRLDKDTTGCLLVAKTREAHKLLQKQFESRTVKKFYLAIVNGVPEREKALIEAPIGRLASDRTKMGIHRVSGPRDATTSYQILSASTLASLLLCELHTGRTHQIRVHLHAIGHPLLGDDKYANQHSEDLSREYGIDAVCLHAWKLSFVSPANGKEHAVEASIPKGFSGVMKQLGLKM